MTDVVYLFGAGASHGCVDAVGSPHGILMEHLSPSLVSSVRELVKEGKYRALDRLANLILTESTDFEHIITFLDSSSSALHREFASRLREIFQKVLRERLELIDKEHGSAPVGLYEALIDMHCVPGARESIKGALTLNYDEYFEVAAKNVTGKSVNYGIALSKYSVATDALSLIKLHGSMGWRPTWPIEAGIGDALWIPPGIHKAKDRYPFNILWGLARELLDCNVLRIVGCKLGPNDWDLIALIFATQHDKISEHPYRIEIIDSPKHAIQLQKSYPYLSIHSIFELPDIGKNLVSEFGGIRPQSFESLSREQKETLIAAAGSPKNWFRVWLKQKAEAMHIELSSLDTPTGVIKKFLETHA